MGIELFQKLTLKILNKNCFKLKLFTNSHVLYWKTYIILNIVLLYLLSMYNIL